MTKAVFTTKVNPTYDDLPEVRYHFPRTYLNQVRAAVGDWIIYYEPRRTSGDTSSRGGRQAYFAVARVASIEPDASSPDHHYARMTDYIELVRPVPFREGQHYFESVLKRSDGQTSKGAFGRAVRTIPDPEFELILAAGFSSLPASNDVYERTGFSQPSTVEDQAAFDAAQIERPLIQTTLTHPFRNEAFRRHVRIAYDNRCAISGPKLINGGGRPEVQAAHIQPVASSGPDSVRNGLALSGTLHWMFDRGLISIGDDFSTYCAPRVSLTTSPASSDPRRTFSCPKTLLRARTCHSCDSTGSRYSKEADQIIELQLHIMSSEQEKSVCREHRNGKSNALTMLAAAFGPCPQLKPWLPGRKALTTYNRIARSMSANSALRRPGHDWVPQATRAAALRT